MRMYWQKEEAVGIVAVRRCVKRIVHSRQSTVHGRLFEEGDLVDSLQWAVNSRRSTVDSPQRMVESRQFSVTVYSGQLSDFSQRSTVDSPRWMLVSRQITVGR